MSYPGVSEATLEQIRRDHAKEFYDLADEKALEFRKQNNFSAFLNMRAVASILFGEASRK